MSDDKKTSTGGSQGCSACQGAGWQDLPSMTMCASGIDHDPLPGAETESNHVYAAGDKILELTDDNLRGAMAMGFSTFNFAAGAHFNQDITPDGRGDWRAMDAALDTIERNGARAVLAAGYWWMPPWMANDDRAVPMRCLAHDRPSPILSVWSEFTCEWIERCVSELAEHLGGRAELIAGLVAMLGGDFGEAMFPAGYFTPGTHYGPPVFDEVPHNHSDFWCGDACAQAQLRRFMTDRFGSSVDIPPTSPQAGGALEPWLAFVQWHHDVMTRHAQRVVGIYRQYFPTEQLMIWLGGGTDQHALGQDNTALPKAMKSVGGSIRATTSGWQPLYRAARNPADSLGWSFRKNYPVVKRVATACRFYDVPLWLEPPYPPAMDAAGVAARVFEAVSCDGDGYFEWTRTLQKYAEPYVELANMCKRTRSIVDVAVYYPTASHYGDADSTIPEPYWSAAAHLRAITDFDVVDDLLITDGALDRYAVLFVPQCDLFDPGVLARLDEWVAAGGVAIAACDGPVRIVGRPGHDDRPRLGVAGDSQLLAGDAAAGADTPWLEGAHKQLASGPARAFSGITDQADVLLSAAAGPAVIRRRHGRGQIIACAPTDDRRRLSAAVLGDYLLQTVGDDCAAGRLACQWMTGDEELFASVTADGVVLANLSDRPISRQLGKQEVALKPYELTTVQRR